MITKYVGVFCVEPKCGRFNVLTTYQVERPEQIATDCRLFPVPLVCNYCGGSCYHLDEAIAHALSPDGKEPQYPNRR
jgi:hypothetical protein